jgi:antimicrobial peptide system SdpA family protein
MSREVPLGPRPNDAAPFERVFGASTLLLAAFWLSVAFYALHTLLPFNAVDLPAENDVKARLWAPQGWKFFTRNPREDWLLPFRRAHDGNWKSASLGPNGRADAYFGISRLPRAQGIEMGLLLYKLPKAMWDECNTDPVVCLEHSAIKATLRNKTPNPTLCGIVGFADQRQTPWAWQAHGVAPRFMPSRIAKFEVKC